MERTLLQRAARVTKNTLTILTTKTHDAVAMRVSREALTDLLPVLEEAAAADAGFELVMAAPGSYQYRWEAVESGWDELRALLGDFASHFISDDEPSLDVSLWGHDLSITVYTSTNSEGAMFLTPEITRGVAAIRPRVNTDLPGYFRYRGMSVTPFRSHDRDNYNKVVFNYELIR